MYSENYFINLAATDPKALAKIVGEAAIKDTDLTFAAEHLGSAESSIAVLPLLKLLEHPSAIAREGAVIGLDGHFACPGVRDALEKLVAEDPSEAVREAAQEVLDYYLDEWQ